MQIDRLINTAQRQKVSRRSKMRICNAEVVNIFLVLLISQIFGMKQNALARNGGHCILDGDTYHEGQQFVTKDCSLSCTCSFSKLTCQTSCPVIAGSCPKEQKIEFMVIEVEGTPRCRCPKKRRCIHGGPNAQNKYSLSYLNGFAEDKQLVPSHDSNPCYVHGKKYLQGETYITEDCQAICICKAQFASCRPLCNKKQLTCPNGFSLMHRPVAVGSHCFCTRPTCLENLEE